MLGWAGRIRDILLAPRYPYLKAFLRIEAQCIIASPRIFSPERNDGGTFPRSIYEWMSMTLLRLLKKGKERRKKGMEGGREECRRVGKKGGRKGRKMERGIS